MSTVNELTWQSLTAAVNEIKSPNQFLRKYLFGAHQTVSTETIAIDVLTHLRTFAPMVRKNGEAVLVEGHDETFQTVSPPNIRIKRAFTPSELLFNRRAGTPIFITAPQQISAIQQHINRDLQIMADNVTNTEEWLCSQALIGQISYNVGDTESYQITYSKPSGNTVTLSTFWDNGDPTAPNLETDTFDQAKILMSNNVSLGVTDAIMGSSAAEYFKICVKKQYTNSLGVVWNPGQITVAEQFTDDGVIYLGTFCGVRCWQYIRTIPVPNGDGTFTTVPMIRDKYVEFCAVTPAAERVLYYGAIADMDTLQGSLFQTERFAKSWKKEDPSAMFALLHTRPLPVPRRPGSLISFKVVSG